MRATPDSYFYLTVEIVREIHAEAITRFGGSDGVRDMALLESAVAAPQASFGGKSTYSDIAEVASAYLYYVAGNHPFIDGNKRIAFTAADVFLRRNGSYLAVEAMAGYEFIVGSMERHEFRFAQILEWIHQHSKPLL